MVFAREFVLRYIVVISYLVASATAGVQFSSLPRTLAGTITIISSAQLAPNAKTGSQVLVPFRGSEDSPRHLKLMGDLGQINSALNPIRTPKQQQKMINNACFTTPPTSLRSTSSSFMNSGLLRSEVDKFIHSIPRSSCGGALSTECSVALSTKAFCWLFGVAAVGTQAGMVISIAASAYLIYQHVTRTGGIKKAFDQGVIVPIIAAACLICVPFIFLVKGYIFEFNQVSGLNSAIFVKPSGLPT